MTCNLPRPIKKTFSPLKMAFTLGGIAAATILIYGGILLFLTWPIDKLTISNAGVFGDSFGVLTSFFSALAFGGVAVTIAMQRDTMDMQKSELQQQKIDLDESRKEQQKQGFENTFFQMIRIHNQIVTDITTTEPTPGGGAISSDGRSVMNDMKRSLLSLYFRANRIDEKSNENDLSVCFQDFYKFYGHQLGHYFRFLYNTLRFLSEAGLDPERKLLYSRIIRAQLSDQELCLIYYNAFTPYGERFIKYMVEFKLMDNLDPSKLPYPEHSLLIENVGFTPIHNK